MNNKERFTLVNKIKKLTGAIKVDRVLLDNKALSFVLLNVDTKDKAVYSPHNFTSQEWSLKPKHMARHHRRLEGLDKDVSITPFMLVFKHVSIILNTSDITIDDIFEGDDDSTFTVKNGIISTSVHTYINCNVWNTTFKEVVLELMYLNSKDYVKILEMLEYQAFMDLIGLILTIDKECMYYKRGISDNHGFKKFMNSKSSLCNINNDLTHVKYDLKINVNKFIKEEELSNIHISNRQLGIITSFLEESNMKKFLINLNILSDNNKLCGTSFNVSTLNKIIDIRDDGLLFDVSKDKTFYDELYYSNGYLYKGLGTIIGFELDSATELDEMETLGFLVFNDVKDEYNSKKSETYKKNNAHCDIMKYVLLELYNFIANKDESKLEFEVEETSNKSKRDSGTRVFTPAKVVVKSHFRHYKSGAIALVKPHIRGYGDSSNVRVVINL